MQPPTLPLCRVSSLAPFVRVLRDIGAPVDSALARARLPLHFEERPHGWLSYVGLRRFLAAMAAKEQLPDLGGIVGRQVGGRILDGAVASAIDAPTLFHALVRVGRHARGQSTHLRLWLEPHGENVRVCHRNLVGPEELGYPVIDSNATLVTLDIVRRYLGPDWLPARVICRSGTGSPDGVPYSRPLEAEGVEIEISDRCGGFEIPARLIGSKLREGGERGERVAPERPPEDLVASLEACLATHLMDGRLRIEEAAEICGVPVRTLQRALDRAGTTYTAILDRARFAIATEQLENGDRPLTEIALALGYSEQSAFSRAFRGWTGIAPSEYRKRARRRVH